MATRAANHALRVRSVAVLLAVMTSGICSASAPWCVPAKGSNERAQIMDVLQTELVKFDATNQDLIL